MPRAQKTKQLLADPQYPNMASMDILLESGFDSKSSFHQFFKRYTGMSAADFCKQNQVNPPL